MTALRLLPGVALLAASLLAQAEPGSARLLAEKSRIVFVTKQMGVPVEGAFASFRAQVALEPQRPEAGHVALQIDTGSASLGVPQVDAELSKPVWFDAARFPQAAFRSTTIRALGGGRFDVAGQLTIKGTTQDVLVPVTLTQADGLSVASGSFTIQRRAFKVGDGEWADTSMVGNDVQVRFKLTLSGLSSP